MKWNVYGEQGTKPFFIFVVGDIGCGPDYEHAPILCTLVNGFTLYLPFKLVKHLTPATDEETLNLAGRISKVVVMDAEQKPTLVDGGIGKTPLFYYSEHFKREVA